ncbi:MAG: alpha/beta fold hydrolase [Alphaproteobacteria bacterium]
MTTLSGILIRVGLTCAMLAVGACAPRLQAPGPASPPVRPMLGEAALHMADGTRLPLMVWRAEAPRAVILALHGMNDYANAFAASAAWWAREAGITVYAYDQRGFGRTEQRGVWPGSDRLIEDAGAAVTVIKARHRDLPVFLLGHSMGGAVALAAVAEGVARPDGVILAAPAVWGWSTLPFLYRASLWLAAHTLPWKTLSGGRAGVTPSDNIAMLRALSADPLVIKETRIDAAYGLVSVMDRGYEAARPLAVPVLLLYGLKDELVPEAPVRAVIGRLCPGHLDALIYEGSYHMLLRDLAAHTVRRDVAHWIDGSTGPGAKGSRGAGFAGTPACPEAGAPSVP